MFRIVKLGTTEKLILAITTSRFSSGAKYTASSITATFYKVNDAGDALEIDTAIGTSGVVTLSADTGSKTGFHTALLDVSALTAKVYCVIYEATVDSVAAISEPDFLDIDAERKKIADYVDSALSDLALQETAESIEDGLLAIKGEDWTNESLKAIYDKDGGATLEDIEAALATQFELFGNLRTVLAGGVHSTTTFQIDLGTIGQGLDLTGYSIMFNKDGSNPYSVRKIQSWEDLAEGITAITVTEALNSTPEDADIVILGVLPQESIRFSSGKIYVDAVNGSSGTDYPLGEPTSPVDNIANALTIAEANNILTLFINGSMNLDLDVESMIIEGAGVSTNLNLYGTRSYYGTTFKNSYVQGVLQTVAYAENCSISLSFIDGGELYAKDCALNSISFENIAVDEEAFLYATGCYPVTDTSSSSQIVFSSNGAVEVYMTDFKGVINADGMASEDNILNVDFEHGQLIIGSGCTGGNTIITGSAVLENNGTSTLIDNRSYKPEVISGATLEDIEGSEVLAKVDDLLTQQDVADAMLLEPTGFENESVHDLIQDVNAQFNMFSRKIFTLQTINEAKDIITAIYTEESAFALSDFKDYGAVFTDGSYRKIINFEITGDRTVSFTLSSPLLLGYIGYSFYVGLFGSENILDSTEIQDACTDALEAGGYDADLATQIETNLDAKVSEVEGGGGGGATLEEIEGSTILAKEATSQEILSLVGGSGSGANEVILTVETAGHVPIASVAVHIWNSAQTLLIASGVTSALGMVTIALDDGSYKVRLNKIGYNFTVPENLTVSGDTDDTYTGTVIPLTYPDLVDACEVYEYLFKPDGITPLSADEVVAIAKIVKLPHSYGGKLHIGNTITYTYDALIGRIAWPIVWGAQVEFTIEGIFSGPIRINIPQEDDARLYDIYNA